MNVVITKKKAAAFKREVVEVCRKHGISISHQDNHGAFMLEELSEDLIRWFMQARPDVRD